MSTTLPGKVHWHMHALAVAIQDPAKNVLVVFGSHECAKISFEHAVTELFKNIPEYPMQLNYQNLVITMAEGGRIHFKSLERVEDCQRVGGLEFATAIYDESWSLVKGVANRDYIRHRVAGQIRQR